MKLGRYDKISILKNQNRIRDFIIFLFKSLIQ